MVRGGGDGEPATARRKCPFPRRLGDGGLVGGMVTPRRAADGMRSACAVPLPIVACPSRSSPSHPIPFIPYPSTDRPSVVPASVPADLTTRRSASPVACASFPGEILPLGERRAVRWSIAVCGATPGRRDGRAYARMPCAAPRRSARCRSIASRGAPRTPFPAFPRKSEWRYLLATAALRGGR